MYKSLSKILLLALGVVLINILSCKKNNLAIDTDLTPPPFAKFNASSSTGTYYIKDGGTSFKIPVGVTTKSSQDRTINFSYTSNSATAGAQYNAPASIVIPAGEVLDSLSIDGIFAGYPSSSRIDTLVIKIEGGDVPANDYNKQYTLILRKYCEVILPSLEGVYELNEYSSSGSFSYGPYGGAVVNLVSTGPTTASGEFVNLYDYGWDNITFTMDWSDPANFKISIPLQATNGGGEAFVRSTAGKPNTFSSCDETFTISLDLFDDAMVQDASGYQIRFTR